MVGKYDGHKMILHIFHVYFIGGFKKSRELNWVIGVVLEVLTRILTGYSLPRDQIGYWAVIIITVDTWMVLIFFRDHRTSTLGPLVIKFMFG